MMVKTVLVLFFVAICAAVPLHEIDPLEDAPLPALDPQATEPVGEGSDLKTDSTFWGYYGYPTYHHRRSYYAYRPRYYYYPSYPRYWGGYW